MSREIFDKTSSQKIFLTFYCFDDKGKIQMELPSNKFDQRPYIDLIDEIYHTPEHIRVFLVDGNWVRKYIQREFTNFAHHDTHPKGIGGDAFKEIPEHEFWIDQGANEAEIPFFIDHLLLEHYLMTERGMSYQAAEREGIRVEERERHRGKFKERQDLKINPEIRLLKTAGDVQIYLVDGKMVRDKIDPRFCSGGHSEVYGYIPDKHIWVDNTSVPHEYPFYIIHELNEFRDMQIGKEYPEAHKIASKVEWQSRWDPNELLRQQKQLGLL